MKTCRAIDCKNRFRAKGWCWNHYYYSRNHGEEKALSHIINPYNVIYVDRTSRNYKQQDNRSKHPLIRVWRGMLNRCYNIKGKAYKYYGRRGIIVCEEWGNDFWQFVKDMGDKPKGLTLDRRDNNGNYESTNCRWVDSKTQANNKRKSHLLTSSNLAKVTGYSSERIRQMSGMSKQHPDSNILSQFIEKKEKLNKSFSIIFKPETILFLINHRQKKKLSV